jgi:hypothetical protein
MPNTTYRILVTGSRDWTNRAAVEDTLTAALALAVALSQVLIVVHGACRTGTDAIVQEWAERQRDRGRPVEIEPHRAEWRTHGLAAGPIRNQEMVDAGADAAFAFIGPCRKRGCSRPQPHGTHGASGCAEAAEAAGIPVRRCAA